MVKKEISKEQKKNKSVSVDLLESYRKALYKVKQYFDSIDDFDMGEDIDKTMKVIKSILDSGSALGKNIETLAILEKKVQADELTNSKIRGGAKLSLLEDGQL